MHRLTFLIFVGVLAATAQTTTGALFGVAQDTSGGVLPGVEITARHIETSLARKTVTDNKGEFLITNLPVGQYSLTAAKTGFRQFVQEGIRLEVNQNARVDISLTIGAVTESVSVTADAI